MLWHALFFAWEPGVKSLIGSNEERFLWLRLR